MTLMSLKLPQKTGLGLRSQHYSYVETHKPNIAWFEILSDNYLCLSGPSLTHLEKICASYPITLHGVGMSLGSSDPLNFDYLKKLKSLMQLTKPLIVSDHLCWTALDGKYFHELLPLPYTEEAVKHTAARIQQVQDFLGQQIMIENVSSYLCFKDSVLHEADFLQAVAETADCLILLDVNNVYVSAYNNQFDAEEYLKKLDSKRIAQFHLAGFSAQKNYLLDTHGAPIQLEVWELFQKALQKFGARATCIEWDNNIPEFSKLKIEADKAQQLMEIYVYTT